MRFKVAVGWSWAWGRQVVCGKRGAVLRLSAGAPAIGRLLLTQALLG